MAKKKQYVATLDTNPKRKRLTELEEIIHSWWHGSSGKLWDSDDPYVDEILAERDELFYELNPHLTGLSFNDMKDEDWEKIDQIVKEENADKGKS